ncbi:MAG: XdhC/CoxI family protein [Clostridiales bacterium]|nr:XdhC/CoxI family protein [Clostridiales bacterium]MDD7034920.1 XdhC/CoxI family protein [Bacillota bacterium]MDY2920319.1 XdhC/CoxI family protein [Lentihominibacter sp.]
MANKIAYKARDLIELGDDFILASVVETEGSTPRKKGADLIMWKNGEGKMGTVGGGLLEAETEKICIEMLKTKEKTRRYEFILDEDRASEEGALAMGCGGNATVQLEYIEAANPGDVLKRFEAGSKAYVFGGGHVAYALEPILRHIDFDVTIIDDREEFANPERYPEAERTINCGNFDHCFDELDIDEDSYIIIVTRGHRGDLQVLRQALQKPYAYLGMIGSRNKNEKLYSILREEGVTEEQLSTVHAPIGLEIGSETPEEIGVSIAAEIIQVRASR